MSVSTLARSPHRRMAQLRTDPITGHQVLLARGRAERPFEFERAWSRRANVDCPFCAGQEAMTPGELLAFRAPDGAANDPAWRVRVIPNKYPAVAEGEIQRDSLTQDASDSERDICGAHEVIIESPQHLTTISQLSAAHWVEVLEAYRLRVAHFRQDSRFKYAMVFKNSGAGAGASIEHLHSQLVALPVVPGHIAARSDRCHAHFRNHGRCLVCEVIGEELAGEERIVAQSEDLLAFCPRASRFPYETWIVPKLHAPHFDETEPRGVADLGRLMQKLIGGLEAIVENVAYNYVLDTSPLDALDTQFHHWHIEITPRLTTIAGFELGTGMYINPMPPEEAAARLRSALPDA